MVYDLFINPATPWLPYTYYKSVYLRFTKVHKSNNCNAQRLYHHTLHKTGPATKLKMKQLNNLEKMLNTQQSGKTQYRKYPTSNLENKPTDAVRHPSVHLEYRA